MKKSTAALKMGKHFFNLALLVIGLMAFSCGGSNTAEIPYYGERQLDANGDTIYYTVPDFSFTDQDGKTVDKSIVEGKLYVTDFFFTTCPTICPRMKDQMLRVYHEFKGDSRVKLISHTIDPKHDTVALLNDFAYNKLEIEPGIWHFVTGEQQKIYDIARDYMVVAGEDGSAPGGYIHSGKFVLVDQNGHIRGYYDGTDPLTVADLMRDMKTLLEAQK